VPQPPRSRVGLMRLPALNTQDCYMRVSGMDRPSDLRDIYGNSRHLRQSLSPVKGTFALCATGVRSPMEST